MPVLSLLLVLLAGVSNIAQARILPEVGETVSGTLEIAAFDMPIPDGAWEVYYAQESLVNNTPEIKLGLLKTKGKVVSQIIYLIARGSIDLKGFQRYANCELDGFLFSDVRVNRTGLDQDCWHIRAEDLTTGEGASERLEALMAYAGEKSYRLGLTTVGPRFHMASKDSMIRTYYGWLPDAILPPSKNRKVWIFADWTDRAVEKDPRKQIVFRTLKAWAEEWYPTYRKMFTSRNLTGEE